MFEIAFDRVFVNEGGFQNDPHDRGNWTQGIIGKGDLRGTKYGLSAMTYPHLDIQNLTRDRAMRIYRKDWWDKLGMEDFPEAIQYQMLDAAVNHGMRNATKILQHAVGEKADGLLGPRTMAATANTDVNDLLLCFLAERLIFMTNIKTWKNYGKGWARRIAYNLRIAAKDN